MGRGDHRRSGLSPRGLTAVGAGIAVVVGCVLAWTLSGDGPDEDSEFGSIGGCVPAPAICSVPGGGGGPGFSPGGFPGASPVTPNDAGASATPPATAATSPHPVASKEPVPTPRVVRRVTPPPRATMPSRPSATRRTSAAPTRAPTLAVNYSYKSRWDGGYVVLIRFTNSSRAAWNGWVLSFRLGDGSRIASYWNTRLSGTSGYLRAADDDFNAVLAPGEQADFGMEGTRSFQPSGCTLNGQPCRFQFTETTRGRGHGR